MSDLKHQTPFQLCDSKRHCEERIRDLGSRLSGQRERLKWIDHYLHMKTPQELTIAQVEARLGHRVIIREP